MSPVREKRKCPPKPIEEQCRDLASQLMDDLTWDIDSYVPSVLWRAAEEIERLKKQR